MIKISDLTLLRGSVLALSNYAGTLAAGSGAWLVGPNGSGKTSLLRALAGLLPPLNGVITVPADRIFIGTSFGHDDTLSVHNNLCLWGDINSASQLDIDSILQQAGLLGVARQAVGALSAGQQQRLALARLLCKQKDVWLLDEPFSALDSDGQVWLCRLMSDHLQRGGLIVCATHRVFDVPGMITWDLAA
jgi:heme exporter protein A